MGMLGLGLRREHFSWLLENQPQVTTWFEAISENFMDTQGRPLAVLEHVRGDRPVALHGVSLSIGSVQRPNEDYLESLASLVERIDPFLVSDHFCFTHAGRGNLHDLLPLPFTEEAVQVVARNVSIVQERLGRRVALENVSSYLMFRQSTMTEWEFIAEVVRRADCRILLDVNNVYVNASNHGFEAQDFLRGIPAEAVAEIHIGGHAELPGFLFDTHGAPVAESVWDLLRLAVERSPDAPILLERDEDIPALDELERELARAADHAFADSF